jgi:hypothetical protein
MKIQAYMCLFVWSPYFYLKESHKFLEFFVMGQSKKPVEKKEGLVLYN